MTLICDNLLSLYFNHLKLTFPFLFNSPFLLVYLLEGFHMEQDHQLYILYMNLAFSTIDNYTFLYLQFVVIPHLFAVYILLNQSLLYIYSLL